HYVCAVLRCERVPATPARPHPPQPRPPPTRCAGRSPPAPAPARSRRCVSRPRDRPYNRTVKKRLDLVLVERGLAETRSQAQALVLAGLVNGYDKPGTQVEEDATLAVRQPPRFVSRGGEKLAHALSAFGVDPAGPGRL